MTRLLFACDVHGSEKRFKKLLNAPRYHEGVDIIILEGDICGKFLVTIVHQGASRYSCGPSVRNPRECPEAARTSSLPRCSTWEKPTPTSAWSRWPQTSVAGDDGRT